MTVTPPDPGAMHNQSPRLFRFGTFEADAISGELRRAGRPVSLQDQPFRLLLALLQRRGSVPNPGPSRETGLDRVSPDSTHPRCRPDVRTRDFTRREVVGLRIRPCRRRKPGYLAAAHLGR